MSDRIEKLLAELTLDEKVSLCAGIDLWHTPPVPRLGIPAVKVTDGPNGARGERFDGGVPSACFPCGAALAATWNAELAERVGGALAEEARSKGAHVLLAPTLNLQRTPLGGRHFECYAEDPYLASRIAVAFVRGVQGHGVGACVKHFACNDQEVDRHEISVEVDARALREIYLPPFEAAVREAGAWSVMAAYNRVNGVHATEHAELLRDVLKTEWEFDGAVISDWYATRDGVASANGGLDLEMPGPPRHFGEKLLGAVRDGRVAEQAVDDMARRVLRLAERTGALDEPHARSEEAIDRPEHRALARETACEAFVLLRNEGNALPLEPERLRTLAVIGPCAEVAIVQGGGSARVSPHYAVAPLDALRERLPGVEIAHEPGCSIHRGPPPLDPSLLARPGGRGPGLAAAYYGSLDLSGDPVLESVVRRVDFTWIGPFSDAVDPRRFSARFTGTLRPRAGGLHVLSLVSAGKARLLVDGRVVIDNWTHWEPGGRAFFGAGSKPKTADVELDAEGCEIVVEYSREGARGIGGVQVGMLRPLSDDALERAVAAAARADAAVVCAGLGDTWESEGRDRASLALPGGQAELIERVAAANPRTAVAVFAGGPVAMDWVSRVPAVLLAWYPGQECGRALADVVLGDRGPSGRLPFTFPRRLEDTPAYLRYPGEGGRLPYDEGIFVGYRYYDRRRVEPLFPFGHGLAYAEFEYGALRVTSADLDADIPVRVEVDVANRGDAPAQEVVQLYVRDVQSSLLRPEQELAAFAKVSLAPGETRAVRLSPARRAFSFYDPARGWVAEPGEFELRVGRSSRDIRARARVTLRHREEVS